MKNDLVLIRDKALAKLSRAESKGWDVFYVIWFFFFFYEEAIFCYES